MATGGIKDAKGQHCNDFSSFFLLLFVVLFPHFNSLLQEMLKCNKGERTAELEEALATVLDIIKSVNDSMHQIAITGFQVSGPPVEAPTPLALLLPLPAFLLSEGGGKKESRFTLLRLTSSAIEIFSQKRPKSKKKERK